MQKIKAKKKFHKRPVVITLLTCLTILIIGAGWFANRYLNKTSLVRRYVTPAGQEVYLIGTFHNNHFNRWLDYSMADLLNAVENVNPDIVFIEAREEFFKDYATVDGPIDMAVVYSYCLEHEIPVEMIDWWVVDNDSKANSTNRKRDDMIFANIEGKLAENTPQARVLVVTGAGHFYEQAKRFVANGFIRKKLDRGNVYFGNKDEEFLYPASLPAIWEKRCYFYAYIFPSLIAKDETLNDETKAKWVGGDKDAFYAQQLRYNELFSGNLLYERK